MKKSNKKGFTLIELVVVIAIIGVLAAILVPSMLGYVKKSRLKTANSNAKTAYNAVSGWITDMNTSGTPVALTSITGSNINCASKVSTPTTPLHYAQNEIFKALGDNDKEAGVARIVQMTGSGATSSQSYGVQWRKTTSDDMIGQYPDAIPDVDAAKSVSWGTFFH